MSDKRSRRPKKGAYTTGARQPAASGRPPRGERSPAIGARSGSPDDHIRFRFDLLDIGGPWCLTNITKADHQLLLGKLAELERLTMNEAFSQYRRLGKDYTNLAECPNPETLRRLQVIEMDDIDILSRFEITGLRRLYGIRQGNEFSIMWWDPKHEVWPSVKKHT